DLRRRIWNAQNNAFQPAHTTPPAIQRHFIFALIGFVFLAVYGSWVPLKLSSLEPARAGLRLWAILQQPLNCDSRTDWITNVLLFVPIGFVAAGLVENKTALRRCCGRILPVVASCLLLSLTIEFG